MVGCGNVIMRDIKSGIRRGGKAVLQRCEYIRLRNRTG
jgi:hypothetical protein